MSTLTRTPVKATPQKVEPITDSPGTWRHPRLNEISRRRNATTFSEKNVKKIAYNVLFVLVVWGTQVLARSYLKINISPSFRYYFDWAVLLLKLLPFVNIGFAALPLFRTTDEINDIPLTPAQRKLLGLPPSSQAPTPNASYSTPPRYSRTPSHAGSVTSNRSYNSSPLSGKGSPAPAGGMNLGGSPLTPNGSPSKLVSSIGGGNNNLRRSSIGSPLGASTSGSSLFPDPGSSSPSAGKRTSVGLNNKWLYERGRRSSGGGAWSPLR